MLSARSPRFIKWNDNLSCLFYLSLKDKTILNFAIILFSKKEENPKIWIIQILILSFFHPRNISFQIFDRNNVDFFSFLPSSPPLFSNCSTHFSKPSTFPLSLFARVIRDFNRSSVDRVMIPLVVNLKEWLLLHGFHSRENGTYFSFQV